MGTWGRDAQIGGGKGAVSPYVREVPKGPSPDLVRFLLPLQGNLPQDPGGGRESSTGVPSPGVVPDRVRIWGDRGPRPDHPPYIRTLSLFGSKLRTEKLADGPLHPAY